MAYLEFKNFSFGYEGQPNLFSNINFTFPNTGLVSILSESGSGKSSILNLIANYLKNYEGEIIRDFNLDEIGFVFQNYHLIEHLNVFDNISLPLILIGKDKKEIETKVNKLLNDIGLLEFKNKNVTELSGGQKSRVSLARGLIKGSKVLLLDEPTGALDVENSHKILKLIKSFAKNRLIILVTHNRELAELYSDVILNIKNQKLIVAKGKINKGKISNISKREKTRVKFLSSLKLSYSFLKKKKLKAFFSLFFSALAFGLITISLTISDTGKDVLVNLGKTNFDYDVFTMQEKKIYEIPGQELKLNKLVKLSDESTNLLKNSFSNLEVYPSFDYFLPNLVKGKYQGQYLKESSFSPSFPQENKLLTGRIPHNHLEVVVNKAFVDNFPDNDILNKSISLNFSTEIETNIAGEVIKDFLNFNFNVTIVGLNAEKGFISRPCIYYSYPFVSEFLYKSKLTNLSNYLNFNVDLKSRLSLYSSLDDKLTSFKSVIHFIDPLKIDEFLKSNNLDKYVLTSISLENTNAVVQILESLSSLVIIFLTLALIASFFLELVVIENLFNEKKIELGIYLSFHINKKTFFSLAYGQAFIIYVTLFVLSLLFNFCLSCLGNFVLKSYSYPEIFSKRMNFLSLFLLIVFNYIFVYLATYFPTKKLYSNELILSLKGE